jgi:hypothetical protein
MWVTDRYRNVRSIPLNLAYLADMGANVQFRNNLSQRGRPVAPQAKSVGKFQKYKNIIDANMVKVTNVFGARGAQAMPQLSGSRADFVVFIQL